MIVCVCHGVSDRTIDSAIEDGCKSVRQVTRRCQAGGDCGACRESIREMIRDSNATNSATPNSGLFQVLGVV